MTNDLNLPIQIVSAPICREEDGLAMSSVNQSLSDVERPVAAEFYKVLSEVARSLSSGRRDFEALEEQAIAELTAAGFVPEYVSVRRAENLQAPDRDCDELVVLGAANLGNARLIDNVVVHI
jgi:pantoate--beta-alanine ligase